MKRLITSMLIVLLISVAFIGSFYKGYYCYAEDINYMSDAELEAAYQAYLQSKGGGFLGNAGARLAYTNGKMLNFLTSEYNTTPYKNINQVKGLLAWEKAELESGNTSVLQLTMRHPEVFSLYTQWLLQNHYFGNGVTETDGILDNGVDNIVYSGKLFNDGSNNCLVYVVNSGSANFSAIDMQNYLIQKGSDYLYTNQYLYDSNLSSIQLPITSASSYDNTLKIGHQNYSDTTALTLSFTTDSTNNKYIIPTQNIRPPEFIGSLCIYIGQGQSTYYLGSYYRSWFDNGVIRNLGPIYINSNSDINISETNINFYTNNNNNVLIYPSIDANGTLYIQPKVKVGVEYEPYIVNEGDTITNVVNNYYNDSGEKDKTITVPSDNPSGSGGGGSGGSGGTPPNWSNPYPNLSPDGNGGFNFNFTLPDLNIDWNINGLSEKFPFSIPFDLIRFVSILNAEPETPEFQGTINLIVYQWQIDADLSDFDNLAGIVRNVEFIGFCITLILITRKMIKG